MADRGGGSPPSRASRPICGPPPGCAFHPRCPQRWTAAARRRRPTSPSPPATRRAAGSRRRSHGAPSVSMAEWARAAARGPRAQQALRREGRPLRRERGVVRAVDGVSFTIEPGRRSAWSASRAAARPPPPSWCSGLEEPTGGDIRFEGQDLAALDAAGRRHYRRSVQAVFQDPYASLNPRMRVGAIIAEPLVTNERLPTARGRAGASRSCSSWSGCPSARPTCSRTSSPAASASASPSPARSRCRRGSIVLDEPVSALDVSIRAQILNLLRDLQAQLGLVLPVHRARPRRGGAHEPHDRGDVPGPDRRDRRRADGGRDPKHPYTQALFSAALPSHPGRAARGDHPARRGAEPAGAAVGLPLPSALSGGDAALLDRGAAPAADQQPHGGLSPVRGDAGAGGGYRTDGRSDGQVRRSTIASRGPRTHAFPEIRRVAELGCDDESSMPQPPKGHGRAASRAPGFGHACLRRTPRTPRRGSPDCSG